MAGRTIALQLRLDGTAHSKEKITAEKELRSLNSQLEYFIKQGIEGYEKEFGVVANQDEHE